MPLGPEKSQRRIVSYERYHRDGALPTLIDVCSAAEREQPHVERKHDQIEARLSAYGCSGLEIWDEKFIRGGCRLANAKLILRAGGLASSADQLGILTALSEAGGVAQIGKIEACSGLADSWGAILRCLLSGKIKLLDPNAPLDRAATICV